MKHNRMRFTRCKYLRRWPLDILHRNSRENGCGSFCVANLTSSVRAVFSRREFFLRCSRLNIVLVINFDDTSSVMFVPAAIANLFRIYVDVNSCVLFVRIKIRGQRSRNSVIFNVAVVPTVRERMQSHDEIYLESKRYSGLVTR